IYDIFYAFGAMLMYFAHNFGDCTNDLPVITLTVGKNQKLFLFLFAFFCFCLLLFALFGFVWVFLKTQRFIWVL
ncbi:MAG: hypothetical protein NC192_11375, partial [Muribaculaceae bacterium]|nr:hypothetical protein [Muribaculaceae bacterium]